MIDKIIYHSCVHVIGDMNTGDPCVIGTKIHWILYDRGKKSRYITISPVKNIYRIATFRYK